METILDFIDDEPSMFFGGVGLVITLLFTVWMIIVIWKIFKKANVPAWGSLIPIYNLFLTISKNEFFGVLDIQQKTWINL